MLAATQSIHTTYNCRSSGNRENPVGNSLKSALFTARCLIEAGSIKDKVRARGCTLTLCSMTSETCVCVVSKSGASATFATWPFEIKALVVEPPRRNLARHIYDTPTHAQTATRLDEEDIVDASNWRGCIDLHCARRAPQLQRVDRAELVVADRRVVLHIVERCDCW